MNFTYASIKYLTVDEFNELIEKIPEADPSSKFMKRNLTIFLVAEYCALRASEIGAIRFTDYDPKNNTLFCRRLKGSSCNTLKLADSRVATAMQEFYIDRLNNPSHGNFIFASKSERPINRRTLHTLMKYYCSFTSISPDKWHFHALKHTCAMKLIDYYHFDVRDVQWWLGHKYISNTMIYLNYSTNAQSRLYEKISEKN